MGMYTEIYVNVDLIENIDNSVLNILHALCYDRKSNLLDQFPERWRLLFNSGSYYTPNTSCANLTFDSISNQWSLLGKGDIKNYEAEIETFFKWLMPHIDAESGDFIGYTRYEDCQEPNLVFKE